MSKRITKAEREYYRGMLAALGVVRIHDAETIFHEIVNTFKCPRCGWRSEFPAEFIAQYKAKWQQAQPHAG